MLGIYHEKQKGNLGVVCGVEEKHGEEYSVQTTEESLRMIFSYSYAAMRA